MRKKNDILYTLYPIYNILYVYTRITNKYISVFPFYTYDAYYTYVYYSLYRTHQIPMCIYGHGHNNSLVI